MHHIIHLTSAAVQIRTDTTLAKVWRAPTLVPGIGTNCQIDKSYSKSWNSHAHATLNVNMTHGVHKHTAKCHEMHFLCVYVHANRRHVTAHVMEIHEHTRLQIRCSLSWLHVNVWHVMHMSLTYMSRIQLKQTTFCEHIMTGLGKWPTC